MIARFRRIQVEFGTRALLMTLVLLTASLAFSIGGLVFFGRPDTAVAVVGGLAIGPFVRHHVVAFSHLVPKAIQTGLIVYGFALMLGDLAGWENSSKLFVIAVTTVAVFDLQFWSLSDPRVRNLAPKGHR